MFESGRPDETCEAVGAAIKARFGFRPVIVVRDSESWRAMVDANPFLAAGADPATLHVACLAEVRGPTTPDQAKFLPDEFAVRGSDVYLRLPNGVAKSLLTNAALDKAFATVSTMRNWRTVVRLLERLEA